MSKFKCDSYSGTDMIYKSKIVIHCSTYTYAELEEEYESGVIENPKEIEITSNESCEQMCSANIKNKNFCLFLIYFHSIPKSMLQKIKATKLLLIEVSYEKIRNFNSDFSCYF